MLSELNAKETSERKRKSYYVGTALFLDSLFQIGIFISSTVIQLLHVGQEIKAQLGPPVFYVSVHQTQSPFALDGRIWQSERIDQQMVSTQVQIWNGHFGTWRFRGDAKNEQKKHVRKQNCFGYWSLSLFQTITQYMMSGICL